MTVTSLHLLIANAPVAPKWFKPEGMPKKPAHNYVHENDHTIQRTEENEQEHGDEFWIDLNKTAIEKWEMEYEIQIFFQWPIFYAKSILKILDKNNYPLLEKSAKVGSVIFHKGISSKLVVEAAQRYYDHMNTPEKENKRINQAMALRDQFLKASDFWQDIADAPLGGQEVDLWLPLLNQRLTGCKFEGEEWFKDDFSLSELFGEKAIVSHFAIITPPKTEWRTDTKDSGC